MPDTNVRYPLAAIPKCIFDAAQQEATKGRPAYSSLSINHIIQRDLGDNLEYDYLLGVILSSQRGVSGEPMILGSGELFHDSRFSLKRVRVTEWQMSMLQKLQMQYARDGIYLPASCFLVSWLYQECKWVRDIFPITGGGLLLGGESYDVRAWNYNEAGWYEARRIFYDEGWRVFKREEHLPTPHAYTAW